MHVLRIFESNMQNVGQDLSSVIHVKAGILGTGSMSNSTTACQTGSARFLMDPQAYLCLPIACEWGWTCVHQKHMNDVACNPTAPEVPASLRTAGCTVCTTGMLVNFSQALEAW
jgi:hypothetical protein